MFRLVLLQIAMTLIASMAAGILGGIPAATSALLGGMCCVLPNSLFALRLHFDALRGKANPISFFIGEFVKIALTVTLLVIVVWMVPDLNWLALIAGFVVALKSYIILLFRH